MWVCAGLRAPRGCVPFVCRVPGRLRLRRSGPVPCASPRGRAWAPSGPGGGARGAPGPLCSATRAPSASGDARVRVPAWDAGRARASARGRVCARARPGGPRATCSAPLTAPQPGLAGLPTPPGGGGSAERARRHQGRHPGLWSRSPLGTTGDPGPKPSLGRGDVGTYQCRRGICFRSF